jgi:hypothetical protein
MSSVEPCGHHHCPRVQDQGTPVSRAGRVCAVVAIFNGSNVASRHTELAFRASCSDVVADTAWQAITAWNRMHHRKLRNYNYHLLPQRKKDKFKAPWVKTDVPRNQMVHHQDVMVELSIHLQVS